MNRIKLGKRERKLKEKANEGFELSDERKKFASEQKYGIESRTINILRKEQGFTSRRGVKKGIRRTMNSDYLGPPQKVEKGNYGNENT
ncbi:MAG: hypothetical protein DRQ88_09340 [Epsilonproteobacteria bacterium]|nr:MAG: hypothetical protein DRQ88_09340 [Campylobacterota bacterium]